VGDSVLSVVGFALSSTAAEFGFDGGEFRTDRYRG
jgi:hypothetical protein